VKSRLRKLLSVRENVPKYLTTNTHFTLTKEERQDNCVLIDGTITYKTGSFYLTFVFEDVGTVFKSVSRICDILVPTDPDPQNHASDSGSGSCYFRH
jgi:hypothetical protein